MAVHPNDLAELKRLVTNCSVDEQRASLNRIVVGVIALNNEVRSLKTEIEKLKEQLKKQ